MKYKVLYRKYRPDNFDDIVGQEYIIKTLKNSIINGNISHAYIFSGPRGTGKTTTAKVFSKAINCLNPHNGSPCGECEFCKNFHDNPDIIEIDAASNNGVDEIRELIENVKLTPTNGKYKVYIIDEVHMLSTSAFNALLLTLEEPPAHSIFILATTNIENVPITILSRCQRYDFQKIKIDDIINRLKYICELEKIDVDEDALTEIAYLSEGGMRDALSLLDQLSKSNQKITLELIEKQIKTISQKNIDELLTSIEDNNVEKCLNLINEYRIRAVDYKTLIKKIIEVSSQKAKNIKISGIIKRLDFNDYKNFILKLADSLNKININVDSYTILEMIILDFFESSSNLVNNQSIKEESPKVEIKKGKEEVEDEKSEEIVDNNSIEDLINIRINNCFVDAQKKYLEEAKEEIANFIFTEVEGKVKSILIDSSVVAASSKNLIIVCNNIHNVETANKMVKEIEDGLNKEFNKMYKIIFISNERWLQEKEKYIENLKTKTVYKYIEEKEIPEEETIVNSVFDKSKIEII